MPRQSQEPAQFTLFRFHMAPQVARQFFPLLLQAANGLGEIVRALNDHRKALGLAIADRIELRMDASDDLLDALTEYQDWIAGEVLATSVTLGATDGEAHTLTVEGHSLRATTRKVDG